MIANLHMHSIFSDGAETPEKVVELAANKNFDIIALTDHNTFEGYERFKAACEKIKTKYIKGVEINAEQPEFEYNSEILAYFPFGGSEKIEPLLKSTREWRSRREENAIKRAKDIFNVPISYSEISEMTFKARGFSGMISNKMIYQYLCSKGLDLPPYSIFQDTTTCKRLWSADKENPCNKLIDIIGKVTNSGGFAVMPHFGKHCHFDPLLMRKDEKKYIEQLHILQSHGLWGIEMHPCRYLPQANEINQIVKNWAEQIGLAITYGSDFHGGISVHNKIDGMYGEFIGFPQRD